MNYQLGRACWTAAPIPLLPARSTALVHMMKTTVMATAIRPVHKQDTEKEDTYATQNPAHTLCNSDFIA